MKKLFIQKALLSLLIFIISNITIVAKTVDSDKKKAQIAFPIIPIIAEFEYSPFHFSQMLSNHPKYSMIEATFDSNGLPSLEVVLTEKENSKRIYYSNSEEKVNQRKIYGAESILTKIDFKMPNENDEVQMYGIGFSDKYEQPVVWRVTPTTPPSEYGKGVRDIPWNTNLYLEYVDLGSTIGAGTAVKIGDDIIQAEPWKEISSPPYFYAYRGSYSVGRHLGIFFEGNQNWKQLYASDELKEGAVWKFRSEKGRFRVLQIASQKGNVLTVNELPPKFGNFPMKSMELVNNSEELSMRSMQIKHNSESLKIEFNPALPLQPEKLAGFETKFEIKRGKLATISKGIIKSESKGNNYVKLMWLPKSPKFAKSKSMEAIIKFNVDGYSIETRTTK